MEYVPPIGGAADDPYIDAVPASGIDGSVVPAGAIEDVMREVVHVIETSGQTPASEDLTQLYAAIAAMIGASLAPDATTTVRGIVELATNTETTTGTDTERAVTPAGLAAKIVALLAASNSWTASQVYTPTTLSISSGVVAWDVTANPVATLELTENVTALNITNAAPGATHELTLRQDATGGRTMAWPASLLWPGGSATTITATAGAEDMFNLSGRDDGASGVDLRITGAQDFKVVT